MPRTSHAQVLRFVWSYVRRHLPGLSVMLVMLVGSTACFLLQPFLYKAAIDAIVEGTPGDRAVLWAASKAVLFGVGAATLALLLEQGGAILLGSIEARLMADIHADVFARVQRLSTGFHVNEFAGATARKISRGVQGVESVLDRIWFNFLPTLALMIGFLVVLTTFAPLIGFVMLVGIVVSIAIAFGLNIVLGRYQSWEDEQDTRMTANLVDAVSSNALVKSFAAEEREDRLHGDLLSEWRRRAVATWSIATGASIAQFMGLMVIELTVLLLAIQLWYRGSFTAGDFVVVMLYVGHLWGRIWDLGRNIREYMKSIAHTEEMVAMAVRPPLVTDAPNAKPLKVTHGAIAIRDLTFHYDNQPQAVFKDFSVTIKPGEKIALVGHSGGGKSTFVKLLLRLYDLRSGSIEIDGQNIAAVTQESLRNSIALVPQDPILFHRSILDNIRYGAPHATMEQVEAAAKKAHAHEFIDLLPHKYDTMVGERGVKLSGGERQRVAIARAILADRPILVLDEATSSLDSLSETYIQEALALLMEHRTSIVIAHRLSTIKRADRILVIERGAIVEEGTHGTLLERSDGVYRRLYDLQAGGFIGE